MARARARRRRQRAPWPADFDSRLRRLRVGHPDRRGAHDRPARAATDALNAPSPTVRRSRSNHAEMSKRLFDRLTLFGRARLDVTIATGALRPTHGGYAVNLLDVSDPSRFRDEAVVTLHELLNLGGGGHVMSSTIVPSCTRRPMMPA